MDYLTDIKPLEDQGMTDAEIASLLSAPTSRDIQIRRRLKSSFTNRR